MYNNVKQIKQLINKEDILQTIYRCLEDTFDSNVRDPVVVERLADKFYLYGHVASIEYNSETAGYIAFYCNNTVEKEGYISMIVVKKGYQNQGIGSSLLQYALTECSKNNMVTVRLEVAKNNTNAIHFYMQKGFVLQSENNSGTYYLCKKI